MSRIGNKSISIIDGVKVSLAGGAVNVEGPKGKLSYTLRPEVSVAVEDNVVTVSRGANDKSSRAFHGLTRALIQNMITGVNEVYE